MGTRPTPLPSSSIWPHEVGARVAVAEIRRGRMGGATALPGGPASYPPSPSPPLRRSNARRPRRGYPCLPTPERATSCPSSSSTSASAEDDAASCCSSDMGSTFTDFSDIDGIALPVVPCESPPLLGPASCHGGRLSSELRSSVPESSGLVRALNPLCYRSLNSALSGCPAPAGKAAVNAARPPQPHGMRQLNRRRWPGSRRTCTSSGCWRTPTSSTGS